MELQNSLERAIVLADDQHISLNDLFDHQTPGISSEDHEQFASLLELTTAKEQFEKKYLENLLRITKGNVSQCSRIAGRIRTDMYRLFSKYSLNPGDYKE